MCIHLSRTMLVMSNTSMVTNTYIVDLGTLTNDKSRRENNNDLLLLI